MDVTTLPDLVHLFAAVGGFATVYGAVKVGGAFAARWKAASASKTAQEDRIAAVEIALRELADVLKDRPQPAASDQAKGAL